MREKGGDDVVVFGGGIIPEEDISKLAQTGVREIFHARRDHRGDRRVGAHQRTAARELRRIAARLVTGGSRCSIRPTF